MEEWQGCLSPLCQRALVQARDEVRARDGYAITVEDFLLALLHGEAAIRTFLRRQGVDMDELIRTVQCEQPIITAIGAEGALSSQLQCWISRTIEITGQAWVDWPDLLATLTHSTERLAQKAYVAVLEQVQHWYHQPADAEPEETCSTHSPPILIDVPEQSQLADDLAVALARESNALIWLNGPAGGGKTALLNQHIKEWPFSSLLLDLRAQQEIMASGVPRLAEGDEHASHAMPVLVLDGVSPRDLIILMSEPDHVASMLIASYQGPILLVSDRDSSDVTAQLAAHTGRRLCSVSMPAISYKSRLAILRIHQPVVERKWHVQVTEEALLAAAIGQDAMMETPGNSIRWLEAAAARTALLAGRGDLLTRDLNAHIADLQRRILSCQAQQEDVGFLELRLADLELEHAASEVDWLEREAKGLLRSVTRDRVVQEMRLWVTSGQSGMLEAENYAGVAV